jgi:hypothetical protein
MYIYALDPCETGELEATTQRRTQNPFSLVPASIDTEKVAIDRGRSLDDLDELCRKKSLLENMTEGRNFNPADVVRLHDVTAAITNRTAIIAQYAIEPLFLA